VAVREWEIGLPPIPTKAYTTAALNWLGNKTSSSILLISSAWCYPDYGAVAALSLFVFKRVAERKLRNTCD